jgi:hypothetical protein
MSDDNISLKEFVQAGFTRIEGQIEDVVEKQNEHGIQLAVIESKIEAKNSIIPRSPSGGMDKRALIQAIVLIATAIGGLLAGALGLK